MDAVINVENLAKQYVIGQQHEQYVTLRDLMADGLRRFGRRLTHPFSAPERRDDAELFWALQDINFQVRQGERIGIIGRNGAGKSTLLKILSRITEPTSGRVAIKGRVSSLLEVGTGFHPQLTGRENIYLNGAILGMSRSEIRRKFDEIVEFAEIEKFLDTLVKRYSSGMYVRLAFAVAAHLEPEILIVDEVLAVGDAQFQKKCLGRMEEVGKEGRTVLFVSHNMTAIRSLCSRALCFSAGRLVSSGEPSLVIGKYLGSHTKDCFVREWSSSLEAPQNGPIRITQIALCDNSLFPIRDIYTNTELYVSIYFETKYEGASAGLTVLIYDCDNRLLLSSINNHEPNWYGKRMSCGSYRSTCKIPANLFNNGNYSISIIIFGKNFSDAVTVSEVLKFEVMDSCTVRGDFLGDFGGIIRPLLEWDTQRL